MTAPAPDGRATLGPLYRADAKRCAELEQLLFPGDDPWSARAFRDELAAGAVYLALRDPDGLLEVADQARATVFLEVRTDNDPARGLYESTGFTVVGLRRRYYRPSGADAYTMRRDPPAPTDTGG